MSVFYILRFMAHFPQTSSLFEETLSCPDAARTLRGYSNRTLFVCQVENVRKKTNVHLISCCLTHSLPLAAIVSQRSHVFLRLRNLIKALTRHTPFMKL